MKRVLIAIGIIICLYVVFLGEEALRLSNHKSEPLITCGYKTEKITETEGYDVHYGLGYELKCTRTYENIDDDIFESTLVGQEFRIFGFLVWAWIA